MSALLCPACLLPSGFKAVQLSLGDRCPARSTVATWAAATTPLTTRGRPCVLTKEEEKGVYDAIIDARNDGHVIDSEVLCLVAAEATKELRGAALQVDRSWAQSFRFLPHLALDICPFVASSCRRRHRLTRLRRASTDRPPLTPEQATAIRSWRRVYEEIVQDPRSFGIEADGPIHADCTSVS